MAKDTFLYRKSTLNLGGKLLDLSTPCVMGIINITPDSFYKNSRIGDIGEALARAEKHLLEGAQLLDIGAYSSRPGAKDVSCQEELDRLIPVIEALHTKFPDVLLSVDTFRASVARAAVDAGAKLVNDISAGELDEAMLDTIASLNVPYIIMHMKGNPQNMQQNASYHDISTEISNYFSSKVAKLKQLGIKDVILDPGFGFSKTMDHNYEVLRQIEDLQIFGLPVLVGVSRKGMIYNALNTSPERSLNGTTILNTIALLKGASILRVHDVKEAVECITLVQKTQQYLSD